MNLPVSNTAAVLALIWCAYFAYATHSKLQELKKRELDAQRAEWRARAAIKQATCLICSERHAETAAHFLGVTND